MNKEDFISYINSNYESWGSAIFHQDDICSFTGWEFDRCNREFFFLDKQGLGYILVTVSSLDVFQAKTDLIGFSYWDNAWWRTC